MAEQTLLIGIGAQKAGTTWLHDYLSAHPECWLPKLKELHYFSGFERNTFEKRLREIENGIQKRRQRLCNSKSEGDTGKASKALEFMEDFAELLRLGKPDPQRYSELLKRWSRGKPVFGEITPTYALLSKEGFREMYGAHPKTRLVFIMRDPLGRLWSAARMRAQNKSGLRKQTAEKAVRTAISGGKSVLSGCSNYQRTIEEVEAVVPTEHIHYEFYERVFGETAEAQAALDRLCGFLGVRAMNAPHKEEVIRPGKPLPLPDDLARDTVRWLRPHYDMVARRFGEMPAAWQASLDAYG